jgi:hypothetical protein
MALPDQLTVNVTISFITHPEVRTYLEPADLDIKCKGGGYIGLDPYKVIICRCAVAIEAFTPKSSVDRVRTHFHHSNR